MATAGGNHLGPPPIISLSSPLHHRHHLPQSPLIGGTLASSPSSSSGITVAGSVPPGLPISGGVGGVGSAGLRESQAPNPGDLSGIFSVVLNRQQHQQQNHHLPLAHQHHVRWPSFSMGNRSFWTKYCLLCTVCGSAATILAGIFLVVAALFRYYTTSIYYFETVPTYIPAILLSICGVSTIAFSCKRNRNIILLRITACWSLCSAALSSVITITTSLIHMNRLQTLKECVYTKNPPSPPSCTCYSHSFGMQGPTGPETTHYLFENTPDCDVIHGILYSCLRAVFAISVVAVLLSIFLCMLLYQLIGHERKKAYWSRIRRINSDWSADFIACLARPMPRERSSLLPLMPSLMPGGGTVPIHGPTIMPPPGWDPPPSYDDACSGDNVARPTRILPGQRTSGIQPTHSFAGTSASGFTGGGFFSNRSSASFAFHGTHQPPPRRLRLVTSHSENSFRNVANGNQDGLMCPHPFSPTITSVDPSSIFKQHSSSNNGINQQHFHPQNNHNNHYYHHGNGRNRHHPHNPRASAISSCSIGHNNDYLIGEGDEESGRMSPADQPTANGRRNFRSLSTQVLRCPTEEEDCCLSGHMCNQNHHHRSVCGQIPQSSSFQTNPSGRNSEFSITSLSMPDNSSMSITMKSSNDIPFNDNDQENNTSSSNCCNNNGHVTCLSPGDDDEDNNNRTNTNYSLEETGFSDQEISFTSTNGTASAEALQNHHQNKSERSGSGDTAGDKLGTVTIMKTATTSSSSVGAVGRKGVGVPSSTSSEPKITNANKNNSFNTVQIGSNSVINSDTDIILNKKTLENVWGSLKKHKNFAYYGGGGNSTSRRKRKDKSKSSLSKISSLPSSPFMNMRRKLFGTGPTGNGKSLECVQNMNYNFSYSMAPVESIDGDTLVLSNTKNVINNTTGVASTPEEFHKGSRSNANQERESISKSISSSVDHSPEESSAISSMDTCSKAEIRPEVA